MITPEELDVLCLPEVREAIAAQAGRDPLRVALDKAVPHARLVATQVKYLARAAKKLPAYAAAGCILPPRAYEQASSEACAAHKRIAGDAVLDLTCGLGVDAYFLSRRFRRVVTLERDAMLCRVARENFRRLGVRNIEVVSARAEEYLAQEGLHFDWVYADPDRRDAAGQRRVRLEECSPDVLALRPRIRAAAPRLCLKLSPLFDVDEALRLFPAAEVEAVSLGGECKEVLVYDDDRGPRVTATALGKGTFSTARSDMPELSEAVRSACSEPSSAEVAPVPALFDPTRYGWLVVPDAALRKARLARACFRDKADIWTESGFAFFATQPPPDTLGSIFAVERIEPFDPHRLKKEWRGRGAEFFLRDFPLAGAELARRLGVAAGSDLRAAFTRIAGRLWTIRLK